MPIIEKPFVPLSELETRRKKLTELMPAGSLLVLFSNQLISRNADVEYPFRQDSSFWYLTGINKAESAITIHKDYDGGVHTKLYTQDRDLQEEIWMGKRYTTQEAGEISGVYDVFWFSQLIKDVKVLKGVETVYLDQQGSYQSSRDELVKYFTSANRRGPVDNLTSISKTSSLLQDLRVIKSDWEIQQLQRASDINVIAHQFAQENLTQAFLKNPDGVYNEKLFEADLYYQYAKNGLTWSYPAIVASGSNGCILHYGDNNDIVAANELLLVDAGCEYNYYASDITRCYHPTGKWSQAQTDVYKAVLDTNQKIIEFLATGKATYLSYHTKSIELLSQALLDLGLVTGSLESVIETGSYKKFYMHGVGHWLGLDVHDLAKYLNTKSTRIETVFEPNMVVTVEPGLYFHPEDESIPKEYRGIAVRIEDDIVIKENGVLNLTQALEK